MYNFAYDYIDEIYALIHMLTLSFQECIYYTYMHISYIFACPFYLDYKRTIDKAK